MLNLNEFKEVWFNNTREETMKILSLSKARVDKIVKENKLFKKNLDLPKDLTKRQYELVIGSLLGDGCLMKPRRGKSNFVEAHGEKQKEYLEWKNDILKPFSREIIPLNSDRVFPNGKSSNTTCYQMYTSYHELFSELERKWYLRDKSGEYVLKSGRRIKCIPDDLELTPFSFAVWFMDDGRNDTFHRNASISTDGFSLEECRNLCAIMNEQFGFLSYERPARQKDQFEIYIPARSYFDCMDLIKEQVIQCECMNYKWDTSKCVVKQKRLTQSEVDSIFAMRDDGLTQRAIAEKLGVTKEHVWFTLNRRRNRRSA